MITIPDLSLISRSQGCLLGGAVGDALGNPVELWPIEQIRARFGEAGISDYQPSYGKAAAITDDTQMTLFTAEGLIRAEVRIANKGICDYQSVITHAYLRWLRTQGETPKVFNEDDGWLFRVSELHTRRAPGTTCISALQQMTAIGIRAFNNSKGCGGVVRVAPVGILGCTIFNNADGPDRVFRLGCESAWITHGNPSGFLPAGCLAVMISALMNGFELDPAIESAINTLKKNDGHEETLTLVSRAIELSRSETVTPELIAELGAGFTGDEALAIALLCASSARDFDHGIRLAVNHSGNSGSTGSITGNLLGARGGREAINKNRWLRLLELRNVIEDIAEDLASLDHWNLESEVVRKLYPGY